MKYKMLMCTYKSNRNLMYYFCPLVFTGSIHSKLISSYLYFFIIKVARFHSITQMPNKNHNKVPTPSCGFSGPRIWLCLQPHPLTLIKPFPYLHEMAQEQMLRALHVYYTHACVHTLINTVY